MIKASLLIALACCLVIAPSSAGAGQPSQEPVYKPGNGVSAPVVVKETKPQYTPEARRSGIQGKVELECVVETNGTVGDVTVTRSLDEGLDQEAVKALKRWTFEPGKKDGKAVRVRVTIEMTFTLR